ncbi:hypothetical protein TCAL_09584 [Tigriopus californicus]|uniref:NUDE domain-containing protein n=1 Tax=Tigriopus californicus TaxID=6832 RepID=A0A553PGV8_TIGCA|nr:nuclear distribution protein nudE-like 1-B [Tigriopus californicus]XP_059082929.1 nuclear distribution protein nudE-like 1-B [Tigriopus californicus]XP_059082930.1 nuclear distribution protein nudE-like 1-B [Tigriopus californicus]TRY76896.1 hypothetical protein TCAL_09584 [Tigriopus californicus]
MSEVADDLLGPTPTFASPTAEAEFWKDRARQLQLDVTETKNELEEFHLSSRELEAELEMQLEQAEDRLKDSRSLANRLRMENDQIRDKLEQCQREYHCQVSDLQSELLEIKTIREQLSKYVRDLEQQNDDLERAKRSTLASLEDFEGRLNAAIERNAFLESELDEKESLKAAVQRMKDETKDLKSELRVLAPRHPNLSSMESSSLEMPDNDKQAMEANNNNHHHQRVLNHQLQNHQHPQQRRSSGLMTADSNKLAEDCETKSENGSAVESESTPSKKRNGTTSDHERPTNGLSTGQQALTPSARISALNIVGDLLRKVGALELKLVSCRNIVKENASASTSIAGGGSSTTLSQSESMPHHHHHLGNTSAFEGTSIKGGPGYPSVDRSKRLPRGASTPTMKKIIDS